MKPNEPSRTALMIARQRAAHQLLDHGSILDDPFAMKILREDEKDVLQFANAHPLASIGRMLSTPSTNLPARSIGHRCLDFEADHIMKLAHAYLQGPGAKLHELLAFSARDFEAHSRSMH